MLLHYPAGIGAGPRCYISDVVKDARSSGNNDAACTVVDSPPSVSTAFCAVDDAQCEGGDDPSRRDGASEEDVEAALAANMDGL